MKRLPSIPLALALALAAAALASSSSSGAAMSAPLLSSPLLHKAHASHHTTSHRPAGVDIIGNIIDASSPPSSMRMRRRPIAFAFRRFHRIARFDVEKRRARASTITITTATAMAATFPNGGDLYDDDELRDVLALHESIRTPTTNANGARDVILARGGGASSDDGGDHGDAGSMTSGGIHDWVLRALEDDGPTMGGGERLGGGGGGCGGGGSGYDIDVESSSVSSDGNDAPSDAMYGGIHDWVLRALEDDGPTSISSGIHDVVTIPTTTPRDDAMGRSDNDQDVGYEMLSISGGIHDWVLWELENDVGVYDDDAGGGVGCLDEWGRKDDDDNDDDELPSSSFSANQLAYDNLRTLLRDRKPHIRAIATGEWSIYVYPSPTSPSLPSPSRVGRTFVFLFYLHASLVRENAIFEEAGEGGEGLSISMFFTHAETIRLLHLLSSLGYLSGAKITIYNQTSTERSSRDVIFIR
jgi:hypothetical protein